MNPNLMQLHPYPFEKLQLLKAGLETPKALQHIALSIGEPQHSTPHIIQEALLTHLHGLVKYPSTKGLPELREAIASWLTQRFSLATGSINPDTQVLPVNGTREALFSIAQSVIDTSKNPLVLMPNPFYQIYEGAAILAGAEPYFLNTTEANGYLPDFDSVPESVWQRCQLLYICSPGNPSGTLLTQAHHKQLIELALHYNFVIASDECYTEIYNNESQPPQGLLQSAYELGHVDFKNCLVFHSLSKRSNAPGLRSGFVAGDADILKRYFQYRTYHGCAMSIPTQHASIAAWNDEQHVINNRQLYREKYQAVIDILDNVCTITQPPASFYIWLKTRIADTRFAQQLFQQQHITVLPGSFLSRENNGINPGQDHVRMALVAPLSDCIEAAQRLKIFLNSL